MNTHWFDAHLDLACIAVNGRDMDALPHACTKPWPPCAVTLPSLRTGNVRAFLGTIFIEPDGSDAEAYPAGDIVRAHNAGLSQLAWYHAQAAKGTIRLPTARVVDVGQVTLPPHSDHPPQASIPRAQGLDTPSCFILVEGADSIREPGELSWWVDRGVVAVGLSWAKSSRYAGGNTEARGLEPIGRELITEIDRLDIVHDVSHLSDRAMDELFDLAQGRVIASHSNCRSLLNMPANQRHLRDASIRAIASRQGVIGLNLFSKFLIPATTLSTTNPSTTNPSTTSSSTKATPRAKLAQCVDHVKHICDLTGSSKHIGLGSDMDGGFSADLLPQSIDIPQHLAHLADALSKANFSDDEIHAFAWQNWARFWNLAKKA